MALTLYLNDGSTEYIFAGMTEEDVLKKIIYERLGRDCEELFTEIISELKGMDGEDYERIADGYRGMAVDAMNGLHEALMQPRLNRKRLEAIYDNLNKNL